MANVSEAEDFLGAVGWHWTVSRDPTIVNFVYEQVPAPCKLPQTPHYVGVLIGGK